MTLSEIQSELEHRLSHPWQYQGDTESLAHLLLATVRALRAEQPARVGEPHIKLMRVEVLP